MYAVGGVRPHDHGAAIVVLVIVIIACCSTTNLITRESIAKLVRLRTYSCACELTRAVDGCFTIDENDERPTTRVLCATLRYMLTLGRSLPRKGLDVRRLAQNSGGAN